MKVDILADGSVVLDPADAETLRERWSVRVKEWQMERELEKRQ